MGKKKIDSIDRYSVTIKECKKHGKKKHKKKNKDIFGMPKNKKKKDPFEKALKKNFKAEKDHTDGHIAVPTDYDIDHLLDSPITGTPLGVYVLSYLEEDGYENTIWVTKVGISSPKIIDIFTGEDVSMKNFRDLVVFELLDMEYLNDLVDTDDDEDDDDTEYHSLNELCGTSLAHILKETNTGSSVSEDVIEGLVAGDLGAEVELDGINESSELEVLDDTEDEEQIISEDEASEESVVEVSESTDTDVVETTTEDNTNTQEEVTTNEDCK